MNYQSITKLFAIGIWLLTASAFALTPGERKIAVEMAQRINSLKADLAERTVKVASLTGTLQAQALEITAQSADLRVKQQQIDAMLAERDGLKAQLLSITLQLDSANNRIADLGKKVEAAKMEAKENARERDLMLYPLALLAAVATMLALVPWANRIFNITFPWTLAWGAAGLAVFFGYYGLMRLALFKVIQAL